MPLCTCHKQRLSLCSRFTICTKITVLCHSIHYPFFPALCFICKRQTSLSSILTSEPNAEAGVGNAQGNATGVVKPTPNAQQQKMKTPVQMYKLQSPFAAPTQCKKNAPLGGRSVLISRVPYISAYRNCKQGCTFANTVHVTSHINFLSLPESTQSGCLTISPSNQQLQTRSISQSTLRFGLLEWPQSRLPTSACTRQDNALPQKLT